MTEQKESCTKCGNENFAILRDMTSRRVCSCGNEWLPEKPKNMKMKLDNMEKSLLENFTNQILSLSEELRGQDRIQESVDLKFRMGFVLGLIGRLKND